MAPLWFLPTGRLRLAGIVMFAVCWVHFMVLPGRGLTPGRPAVGIRAIREDGSGLGRGPGFMREVVIRRVLAAFLWLFAGLHAPVGGRWLLRDRCRQALHGRMLGTLVVQGRFSSR